MVLDASHTFCKWLVGSRFVFGGLLMVLTEPLRFVVFGVSLLDTATNTLSSLTVLLSSLTVSLSSLPCAVV